MATAGGMSGGREGDGAEQSGRRKFMVGLARAYGGAVLFTLPMLMTMEMWWLGFYMPRLRLALFLAVLMPLLVALSFLSGFEKTFSWKTDIVDAGVALFVGFTAAAFVLWMFDLVSADMSLNEVAGKIALQAVPGSMGALLAQSQLGGQDGNRERRETGYLMELLLMGVGALYFAFNVAPTQEMVAIAYKASPWHLLVMLAVSVVVMHAFVYAVEFRGQEEPPKGQGTVSIFLRLTVVGYAVALLVSAYVLWMFDRFAGISLSQAVEITIVLGFPAAIGAAAARLIL